MASATHRAPRWSWILPLALGACASQGSGPPGDAAPKRLQAAQAPTDSAPGATRCAARLDAGWRPGDAARQSGAVALAIRAGRAVALVADEDARAVRAFDVEARAELGVTVLDGAPSQLLVLGDGRVAATLRDTGVVVVLELAAEARRPLTELCRAPVAVEPIAMATDAEGRSLFVTSGWGHALTRLSSAELRVEQTVDLAREPRAVVVDEAGRRATVSHAVGGALSSVDVGTGTVERVDVRAEGRNRREGSQGFALARAVVRSRPGAPEHTVVFAPMVSVDPGEGVSSEQAYGPFRGTPVTPVVAVVDEATRRPRSLDFDPVDDAARTCTLPRAAALASDGKLLVACRGIDALVELDGRVRDPMRVELRRFAVASGPSGVAFDAARGRAVVWSQLGHALTVVDLAARGAAAPTSIAAAPLPGWPDAATSRGRALFFASNDPRVSHDGRACASCHPDGRDDGLTWRTPGGQHQTIMLAGRLAGLAPFGWFGEHTKLDQHVGETFRRLGGRGVWSPGDRADLEALVRYVETMPPPPRKPIASADAARVARGRALFHDPRQGCVGCHEGGDGSDGAPHDVASGGPARERFDTPSLRFVAGTAPYYHDGRYESLRELLVSVDGTMGHTRFLDDADLDALLAYLEVL